MKTKTCIIAILLAVGLSNIRAQGTWIRKGDFGGLARGYAVGFTIGSKGYVGTGNNFSDRDDFWEYDPITNAWTQKADFGGTARYGATGFSIGSKGYIGTGCDSPTDCVEAGSSGFRKDFWEYDPVTNSWARKANFGGVGRIWSVGFSIGNKGYIGTGTSDFSGILHNDFWEYDPASNTWTQKANVGGTARASGAGFSIDGKGYIGIGGDIGGNKKDFWEYDPVTNIWTQKADFQGEGRQYATGLSIGSKGYIGAGTVLGGSDFRKDFYEYDPAIDAWTRKADFAGTARYYATAFSINGKGYMGTGYSNFVFTKDFWEYTPGDLGGSGPCTLPPPGLVSWWSGDQTSRDVQGANPGRLVGGTSFKKAMVGPGFLFDGINDIVVVPNSASLSQTRITLAAWVYPTGKPGTFRHIMSKDYEGVAREYVLSIDSDDRFHTLVQVPSGQVILGGVTAPQFNTWYHVAMTHDGLKLRLYVNGVLDGVADAVGDMMPTQNPLGIGGNAIPYFFQGIIDEAQIFNRVLSDAEILAIHQAGADGQCKPNILVASIDPSFRVRGPEYAVSTSVAIQDVNGSGIVDATVQVKTTFPDGSESVSPITTDQIGKAILSFHTRSTGLYEFKVRRVSHPTRTYDPSLNVETSDTLVIP